MNLNNKSKALIGFGLFVAGGTTVYFSVPTKIQIKEIVKVETKEVNKSKKNDITFDRKTKKTTLPDGTITEETELIKKDLTVIDSNEKSYKKEETKETIITNPRNLHLGLSYKGSIQNFNLENLLDYKSNIGVAVSYDTGVLNTFIGLQVFGDMTTVFTIGIIL